MQLRYGFLVFALVGSFAACPQPGYGQYSSYQNEPQAANSKPSNKLSGWFQRYDDVRRRAQMNPVQKQQADAILSRKLSLFMPGPEKMAGKEILTNLAQRYQQAAASLRALPVIPETKKLQQAYFQYFDTAMNLFVDYLRVQDNLLAVDANGQAIAGQLIQRKASLESLEQYCKQLDGELRASYGVAPYRYQ
ncbi:MAG: hypothetical protein K2W82_06445 [Candidatus Obscuribacterales bacterium]|nr:hypothetical protein [Candidatus Obscuribacterales bacterium]